MMPIQNVGDMSQHFQTVRQTSLTKMSLNRLSNELATQQKDDITFSLGGSTAQLEALEREITRLTRYSNVNQEIGQRFSFMQATLDGIENLRSSSMTQFLAITEETNDFTIQGAARSGEAAFNQLVSGFNQRMGDITLFGGAATDRLALAPAETMLTDIKAQIAGLTTAEDITAVIDDWFDDPAGGFATIGYIGDLGPPLVQNLGANTSIVNTARADGTAARNLLKAAAVAAVADQNVPGLNVQERASLIAASGQLFLSAGDDLTALRASIGANEASIREVDVTLSTQLTVFKIDRNALVAADPFETAARLQDTQQQLELQYTVTARLSQLSLVNFL